MPLNYSLQPYQEFQKAKRLAWNPEDIDLSQDARDWLLLAADEQDVVTRLLSMFVAGEEAVASDLAPLLWALRCLGNLREEEMFVAAQIFEESIHVEFFHRWFDQVIASPVDQTLYWGPNYRALFYEEMPNALEALLTDQSPSAMIRALLAYHLTVEGMLAETGYHAIFLACQRQGMLRGLQAGITLVKRDESRHIAYGVYALQRILSLNPGLHDLAVSTTNHLLGLALGIISESIAPYGENVPFGIQLDEMIDYAVDQFNKRASHIRLA